MIRPCDSGDFDTIYEVINDAAAAYKDVIPADCWHEPYMTREALQAEIAGGVRFWAGVEDGDPLGVMGIQPVRDVTLIRHAYVRTVSRRLGVGGALLDFLVERTSGPLLVGTWAAATWAIRFYEKHGFRLVTAAEKDRLLAAYWHISPRQKETSVVLAK